MVKGGLFISLAFLGLLHQRLLTEGGWFSWAQFWHHESLIAICLAVGLVFLFQQLKRR